MKTVTGEGICEEVRLFFHRMKLVVEPSGALVLAALLSGSAAPARRVGVIVGGGNVNGAVMSDILGWAEDRP